MRATIGKFGHSIVSVHRDQEPLHSPHVVIELSEWSRQSATGTPVVSPDLGSKTDIDTFIAAMKADLDEVGTRAKRALAHAQKRALTLVKA